MSAGSKISHHVASADGQIRHVFVRDLTMLALIGIHDAEKIKPQRIVVNIDLSVQEGSGPLPDDISHVVSY
jgi:dihydroneopterin aldolase